MHRSRRARMKKIGKYSAKTVVMGILERGGKVKTQVLGNERKHAQMREIIRDNVNVGSWLMTDEFQGYTGLTPDYTHLVINHLERYVQGNVHTQGIENFSSLLKRELGGTYVSVEPFHLFRYVDEQAFRFNNRRDSQRQIINDRQRFDLALSPNCREASHVRRSDGEGWRKTGRSFLILIVLSAGGGSVSRLPLFRGLLRFQHGSHLRMGNRQNFSKGVGKTFVFSGSL